VEHDCSRREWLALAATGLGAVAGAGEGNSSRAATADPSPAEPFIYGLNTSTIRGQKLTIVETAQLAAKAGFRGIEPWIREIDEYVKAGGSLETLNRTFKDLGLSVESAIGFFDWVVDDDGRRRKGFDEAKRNMELVRAIGGRRLACPPAGATDRADMDLNRITERYRALLELGEGFGVVPQVEVWGFSKCLGRLGEAAQVAIGADHAGACILPDVYHLYKGGSGFRGIPLLSKNALHVFHMNDYPANPPRATITDADRVYPGDGIAPLGQIFRALNAIGFRGMLSIELFNKAYYAQDALVVLQTGLAKLRAAVKSGLAEGARP
jgi:sugar phosphate isomerase/epimerase